VNVPPTSTPSFHDDRFTIMTIKMVVEIELGFFEGHCKRPKYTGSRLVHASPGTPKDPGHQKPISKKDRYAIELAIS